MERRAFMGVLAGGLLAAPRTRREGSAAGPHHPGAVTSELRGGRRPWHDETRAGRNTA